jgi:hypothetical protein
MRDPILQTILIDFDSFSGNLCVIVNNMDVFSRSTPNTNNAFTRCFPDGNKKDFSNKI